MADEIIVPGLDDDDEAPSDRLNDDFKKLRQAWISESVCPELLAFEQELVEDIKAIIDNQEERLDSVDPIPEQIFAANFYHMELNRAKYLLAKYLRTRLIKLERFAWKLENESSAGELISKLSDDELDYARKYAALMKRHLEESVLRHLPEAFQSFPDPARSVDPDDYVPGLDTFVFCRVKDGVAEENYELDQGGGSTLLRGGEVHVLRYEPIQGLVGLNLDLI